MAKKPRVVASRKVTLRDFVIFQVKLALDGLEDLVVIQLSVLAIIVDLISGGGERPRWFYSVVRVSERCVAQPPRGHGAPGRRRDRRRALRGQRCGVRFAAGRDRADGPGR